MGPRHPKAIALCSGAATSHSNDGNPFDRRITGPVAAPAGREAGSARRG